MMIWLHANFDRRCSPSTLVREIQANEFLVYSFCSADFLGPIYTQIEKGKDSNMTLNRES